MTISIYDLRIFDLRFVVLRPKITKKLPSNAFFYKKILQNGKKALPLHPLLRHIGPFVYRLGREIFIL